MKEVEIPLLMTGGTDLNFFDNKTLSNWAGPNHWKFRAPPKGKNNNPRNTPY